MPDRKKKVVYKLTTKTNGVPLKGGGDEDVDVDAEKINRKIDRYNNTKSRLREMLGRREDMSVYEIPIPYSI